MIPSNLDGIFELANGPMYLRTCFFVVLSSFFGRTRPVPGIALPLRVDLDQADQVIQKGETGYAWHKGHDFGMGIEAVLVKVPRL